MFKSKTRPKSVHDMRTLIAVNFSAWNREAANQMSYNLFVVCITCLDFCSVCGLVVRVPSYRSRGPGFDSRRYQIFWEVVSLERGPLSLVRIIEELGSTQSLTQISTKNLPGGKGRPERKSDNLTAICEPIVYKMWEPRGLTTKWAFTACYRDSF
jgi:hypothetical protein